MSDWKHEQLEKFKEFVALVWTLILDTAMVFVVAAVTEGCKWAIEKWIIKGKMEDSHNVKLHAAYMISQLVMIGVIVIYALTDIVRHIKEAIERLSK